MKHIVKTKISVHSYNLFKLFIRANFGETVEVSHYSLTTEYSWMSESFIMYSYDDESDFKYIQIKFALNGHSNIEHAFLDYEHALRHSVF